MGRGLVTILDYKTWKPKRSLYDPSFRRRYSEWDTSDVITTWSVVEMKAMSNLLMYNLNIGHTPIKLI